VELKKKTRNFRDPPEKRKEQRYRRRFRPSPSLTPTPNPLSQSQLKSPRPQFPLEVGDFVGSAMLEPQRVHRDADGVLPAAVTAPLLAHPPSPAEPSPATVGSPEITDEEIDAVSAACCRICLESDSEPGEPPPPIDCRCSLVLTFSFW
jgi:hypothetical protein